MLIIKKQQEDLSQSRGAPDLTQLKEIADELETEKPEESLDMIVKAVPPPHTNGLYLRIVQQPPSQAVYQRILRPFPTIAIMGIDKKVKYNNLFVEVTLLKQNLCDGRHYARFQQVCLCKDGSAPLGGDKRNMIGGQLMQRTELSSVQDDALIVVFRKLKILTTTPQQGGSLFLLKFVLKSYDNEKFQTVPLVDSVISEPVEVFSHTLYLKTRPSVDPSIKKEPLGSSDTVTSAAALLTLSGPHKLLKNPKKEELSQSEKENDGEAWIPQPSSCAHQK